MTNFTVKNHFKAENAKLVDATVYQVENGTWYMELQYEYEDESGSIEDTIRRLNFLSSTESCLLRNLVPIVSGATS
jgi:hypothetical protein